MKNFICRNNEETYTRKTVDLSYHQNHRHNNSDDDDNDDDDDDDDNNNNNNNNNNTMWNISRRLTITAVILHMLDPSH